MKLIAKFKYLFFGLSLLFLFHFESLSLGPLKISHFWKGILLLFLIRSFLKSKRRNLQFYKPLLILAFLQFFNLEMVNNPVNAILLFSTCALLPLLGIYLHNYSSKELQKGMLFFSTFFILSFLPYELGFIESVQTGYDLTSFGAELDMGGLVGPFQTVHSASSALAGAFLVILYFWIIKAYSRVYLSILLILGFYFLINTYARTGLAMVVLGIIPLAFYLLKKNNRSRFQLIVFGSVFAVLISTWVLSNNVLMDKIKGERAQSSETESVENLGSGRGKIYLSSIEIFAEANFFEQSIGMGQTQQRERMKLKIGRAFIPHNGFLLILLNNGILGLICFLTFLKIIIVYLKYMDKESKPLVLALFNAYLIMTFFQNYDLVYMFLMLVLGFSYSIKKVKLNTNISDLETNKFNEV